MQKRWVIRVDELLLFITISLLLLRDLLNVIWGEFDYSGYMSWSFRRYEGSLTTYFVRISIITLVLCVLLMRREKRVSEVLMNSFAIIGVLTAIWTIHSLITVSGYSIMTLASTAKTVWICMFGLFIGYSNRLWSKFKRYIPFVALLLLMISMGYVLYSFITRGTGYSTSSQSPHWYLYSAGFWLFAYYLLSEKEDNKSTFLPILMMLINMVIVALSVSRGWLIVTILLYIYYFASSSSLSKSMRQRMIIAFVLIGAVGIYLLRDELLYSIASYTGKFQTLTSRTSQFSAFFSQVSLFDLIIGKGEYATYQYGGYGEYMYIDNSFLFYMFHFGFLFMITMFFLILSRAIKSLKIRKINPEGNIGFILILWILACSGFSVYCAGYEVSLRLLFIMMLIGHTTRVVSDTAEQARL